MDNIQTKKSTSSSVVAKAGLWYTICNFIFRGMAFFTAPIFNRLLSKGDLGSFGNYSSWISILIVLTSLDLATSIIRSKVEIEEDIDSYIWSILSFSTILTLILYAFSIIGKNFLSNLIEMDTKYIHLMFLYFLFTPAYTMLITKQRAFYKYKMFVVLTAIVTIASTILSLILVLNMEDKLLGRALGQYIPSILLGAIIFFYLAYKGKRIKLKYWKYALLICVPLVPHTLSAHLMTAVDRIAITKISGPEYNAMYTVAGTCFHIVSIFLDSMNKAWTPWLFEKLHAENYNDIRKTAKTYSVLLIVCAWGAMLMGPELVFFFGGKRYADSVYCLAPLMTGSIFHFIYLMYVNVEFYTKKTGIVAIATMISALLNTVLNFTLIPLSPEKSYIIASYTSFISSIVLLILHYFVVRRLKMSHIYDEKIFALLLGISTALMILVNLLYKMTVVRYIIIVVYIIAIIFIFYKNKNKVKAILKKKKKPSSTT